MIETTSPSEVMPVAFDAHFCQLVKDASCPHGFMEWMLKQQLHTIERFGTISSTGAELRE